MNNQETEKLFISETFQGAFSFSRPLEKEVPGTGMEYGTLPDSINGLVLCRVGELQEWRVDLEKHFAVLCCSPPDPRIRVLTSRDRILRAVFFDEIGDIASL